MYSSVSMVMFLVHFDAITNGEVLPKISWTPFSSREIDHGLLRASATSLGELKKRPNNARYLTRRSIDKSGNKTIASDEKPWIHPDKDDNTTAIKLTGKDPKTGIPLIPDKNPGPLPFVPPLICSNYVDSCEGRCSNGTRFVESNRTYVPMCSCDTSCNSVFTDCCSDYAKHCGSNTITPSDPVYQARSYLECETELSLLHSPCEEPEGVWMVERCPTHYPEDLVRQNCETPATVLDSRAFDSLVPVYSGINSLTYRNQYCAMCHNVTSYEFWELAFWEQAVPPSHFNSEDLFSFLRSNLRYFKGVQPKLSFYVRYCYFPKVVKACLDPGDIEENARCVNGTVEIVHSEHAAFKNRACSSCNDVKSPCSVRRMSASTCFQLPDAINRVVDLQDYGVTTVTKVCPKRQVYDPYISTCRPSYQPFILNSSAGSYKIAMSVLRYASTPRFNNSQLQDQIARNFNISKRQVTNLEVTYPEEYFIISFTLRLSPLQSLIVSSSTEKTSQDFKLWRLVSFKNTFHLYLSNGLNLTVFRVRAQRLACIHSTVYEYKEYTMLQNKRLYINKTKVSYDEHEYELSGPTLESQATVCLKLAPFRINGSYIGLSPNEYTLLPNLTVIYKNSRYNFGEYTYVNGTIFIFVGFQREHREDTVVFFEKSTILKIFNFSCFMLSELFLIALIFTYVLFKELRTLPGKNLLSLAVSLALADFLWAFSGEIASSEVSCFVVAVGIQYFYLVYFAACTVIACHSCYVFGRTVAILPSAEEENRKFIIYFSVTWFVPALFVALFVALDQTGRFAVDYGVHVGKAVCFLGTKDAALYSFVLPIGLSLLFNIAMFVHVAKRFFKNHRTNSQFLPSELQRKRARENVIVCIRLSTLMGFSWLFIFLHLLMESTTRVFLYLFVAFVGLQGVFVGVAFVFNRKCFGLYRELINSMSNRFASPRKNCSVENDTNITYQDTKL